MATSSQRSAARRRPVSRQRYWLRRAGVLVALALVGYSAVRALTATFGGDGNDADAIVSPTADTGATDGDSSAPVEGIEAPPETEAPTTAASTTTTSTTAPERTGPPATDNPARVYIVGDSDAGTFGPYLQTLLDGTLIVDTELNYEVSSGLARPDFFNWPAELAAKVPAVDPDIVVVTFGGNDTQGLSLPQDDLEWQVLDPIGREDEWSEEYERRVDEVLDILLEDDRTVVWVGIPNDDNPDVTAKLALQDQAVRAAIADRENVVFVDTWARFSGRDGGWAEFVIDPRDGEGKDVRAEDGFHLNVTGAEILAIDIAQEVRDVLRDMGATI